MTKSDSEVLLAATASLNEAARTGELRSTIERWLDPEFEYFPPLGVPEPIVEDYDPAEARRRAGKWK